MPNPKFYLIAISFLIAAMPAFAEGGIGLLLSILVVSVPPMAAMFFQGTLGSALTYSVFQGAGGRPGPQGQPAGSGSWAHNERISMAQRDSGAQADRASQGSTYNAGVRVSQPTAAPPSDEIKPHDSRPRPQ